MAAVGAPARVAGRCEGGVIVQHHEHHEHHAAGGDRRKERSTAVLELGAARWASEQNVAAAVLGRRPGVLEVEVNPVSETATVVFDPNRTSPAELRQWVTECGYHCAGQSVPAHLCDPMAEPDPPAEHDGHAGHTAVAEPPAHAAETEHGAHMAHASHEAHAGHAPPEEKMPSPHEVMGHGGHGGMSMAAMVADMRNRFLVAVLFSVPIVIWSPSAWTCRPRSGCGRTCGRCC